MEEDRELSLEELEQVSGGCNGRGHTDHGQGLGLGHDKNKHGACDGTEVPPGGF